MGRAFRYATHSFYEGLPLVILEGLASGCRIVATDLRGTTEKIGNSDLIPESRPGGRLNDMTH
jgi:glycosyltransferase involved in cell wall biosynthesis